MEKLLVRAARKAQQPESFGEVADAGVDEQEFGDPKTRRAERNVAKLLTEQDEARTEDDGVGDDFLETLGLESTGDDGLDLSEAIEECRGLLGEASGDAERVEELSFLLDALTRRSAVHAVTEKMEEQERDRENERDLADMDAEDL